ncbi:MAG: DUF1295 domain-containing protein [Moraxellaceae bacterium]|nr:DUF1295 domain-containing protein [Moraxellaceae bacterium]
MQYFDTLMDSALTSLAAMLVLAVLGWLWSLRQRDVSVADTLWSLFFVLATAIYVVVHWPPTARAVWLMVLVVVWGVRLAVYISARNHGKGEDRRYAEMRERRGPSFVWRSLYIVFGLQAVLAWVISAPLLTGIASRTPLGWLDAFGILLAAGGIVIETIADAQLAAFKRDPANHDKVMQAGLWAYTRHPNYFGEACIWWGLGLMGCAGGAWWTLLSPLLMTVLLLRVSGVSLLEQDITERRPAYREYMARTNAFLPGPRRGKPT